ncbi:MAG: hypothetical protein ALECFALPRED_004355 [Alectoria fallacina]|uniref:Uncharacterized protein n=1 Tax=Alectoria fallacina TaxID=1903189 RepID=A0A8H3HYX3_9LECA|nr:MAG: hypothetical protein ALECFALPRED_004355 [Alectoria fallacina]
MTRDRDLATRIFEEQLEALDHALSKSKDVQVHDAMISERAEVVETLFEVTEENNKQLAEFQKDQGKDAPGRAEDLSYE